MPTSMMLCVPCQILNWHRALVGLFDLVEIGRQYAEVST